MMTCMTAILLYCMKRTLFKAYPKWNFFFLSKNKNRLNVPYFCIALDYEIQSDFRLLKVGCRIHPSHFIANVSFCIIHKDSPLDQKK